VLLLWACRGLHVDTATRVPSNPQLVDVISLVNITLFIRFLLPLVLLSVLEFPPLPLRNFSFRRISLSVLSFSSIIALY